MKKSRVSSKAPKMGLWIPVSSVLQLSCSRRGHATDIRLFSCQNLKYFLISEHDSELQQIKNRKSLQVQEDGGEFVK
jgi:hypothetical protein